MLLEHGYTLLDRSKVKRFLGERGWTAADIEREDDLEALAQALGAEVVVLSRLVLVEAKDGRRTGRSSRDIDHIHRQAQRVRR